MKSLRTHAGELKLAICFLTILPLKDKTVSANQIREEHPKAASLGSSAGWFPWIGIAIGGAAAGAWWLGEMVLPPLLAAVLAVAAWAAITGGLHLDGLADCCDGLFSAASTERRLEIMRDPRLGVFGVIGLVLVLLLKIASIYSLEPAVAIPSMLLAACTGRLLILFSRWQPAARQGGMGGDFLKDLGDASLFLGFIPVAGLTIVMGWHGFLALGLAVASALAIFYLARRRISGVTGDVLGFIVETGELAVLLALNLKLPV